MKLKNRDPVRYDKKMLKFGSLKKRNREILLSKSQILKPGTPVRLLLNSAQSIFSKSYKPIFSEEIFKIGKVKEDIPITYYLTDLAGDEIKGSVYRRKIKETTLPEYFVIEKILETQNIDGKKKVLVKWKGFPDKFNSWMDYQSVKMMQT